MQVSGTRNFQTPPTNQTARFWSCVLVQVSGKSYLSVNNQPSLLLIHRVPKKTKPPNFRSKLVKS